MPPATLNDVFKEVEKFTRFQRIIGMSALIYSDNELQISRKWLIISLISISFNLVIFFYTLYSIRASLTVISNWYCYLKIAYSTVLTGGFVVCWIRSTSNLELLNTSLFRMRGVDLQMNSFGRKLPPTKTSWVTVLIYGLLTGAYFLKVSAMPTFIECVKLLILYSPNILIISFEDNIDRIDSLILIRFQAIKQHLVECFRMEAMEAVPFLEKLVICHHQLSSCSEDIDDYFSVQVISVLGVFFFASFCDLYAISIMYRDEALTYKEVLVVEKVIWIIVMFIIISRVCHQFSAITTEPVLKLHIAMNREVVFTAYGFFKLDYSLLHSSGTLCLLTTEDTNLKDPQRSMTAPLAVLLSKHSL
ncbi:unnamed protein product [Nezara viridula]|uniref:Gustatory receptor n=1 Tax=Nezara viridula TaxID=85310 RepID=A0A9P0H7N7_NEZVI|nr:unnamed protein product [Nezara viridula]